MKRHYDVEVEIVSIPTGDGLRYYTMLEAKKRIKGMRIGT